MGPRYTAVIKQDAEWWIGWIAEIPGVSSQGKTKEELLENLRSALSETLEMNWNEAVAAANGAYEEASIELEHPNSLNPEPRTHPQCKSSQTTAA